MLHLKDLVVTIGRLSNRNLSVNLAKLLTMGHLRFQDPTPQPVKYCQRTTYAQIIQNVRTYVVAVQALGEGFTAKTAKKCRDGREEELGFSISERF